MLVLSRKRGEEIVIEVGGVVVKVCAVELRGEKIRLGIEAPREVPVHRGEIYELIVAQRAASTEDAAVPAA